MTVTKEIRMLEELLSQDQFELQKTEDGLRLIYLMNDAVESFLLFINGRMTGNYREDYEGELGASLSRENNEYVLVVEQGDQVVTVFFEDLNLQVYLYDYGEIGHFWMEGYEYLRQLEYKIAILRDKLEYLGEAYCVEAERELAALADFPPLNSCCYPAVSKAYRVERENPWNVTEQAIAVMKKYAGEAVDRSFLKWLRLYERFPVKWIGKHLGKILHQNRHQALFLGIWEKMQQAASGYPKREFDEQVTQTFCQLQKAANLRREQIEKTGKKVWIFREEPFLFAEDSIECGVYLLIWERKGRNTQTVIEKVEVEEIKSGSDKR